MTETYLTVKWTVSRGRETYGYNVCTLTDTNTGKKYRVNGGGYDMLGSVFGAYLQDVHQDALKAIADQGYYVVQQRLATSADSPDGPSTANDRKIVESGLYGMTTWQSPKMCRTWVTVDGACGFESMLTIAIAAGVKVRKLVSNGQVDGFIVSAGDESE